MQCQLQHHVFNAGFWITFFCWCLTVTKMHCYLQFYLWFKLAIHHIKACFQIDFAMFCSQTRHFAFFMKNLNRVERHTSFSINLFSHKEEQFFQKKAACRLQVGDEISLRWRKSSISGLCSPVQVQDGTWGGQADRRSVCSDAVAGRTGALWSM